MSGLQSKLLPHVELNNKPSETVIYWLVINWLFFCIDFDDLYTFITDLKGKYHTNQAPCLLKKLKKGIF